MAGNKKRLQDPEPQPGPHGTCGVYGVSYDVEEPNRDVWTIPQRCALPFQHDGPHGYAPAKGEKLLKARWVEEESRQVPVEEGGLDG